jgi:hypothetical protein
MMIVPGSAFLPSAAFISPQSYLVCVVANSGSVVKHRPDLDVAETGEATWKARFLETKDIGLFNYTWGSGVQDTGTLSTKTIVLPRLKRMFFYAYKSSWTGDISDVDLEFLDDSDSVIAAIRVRASGAYTVSMQYGASLSSLTTASTTGLPWYHAQGHFTFSGTHLTYTNVANSWISAWSLACSADTIKKVRASNVRCKSNYTAAPDNARVQLNYDYTP